MGLYQNTIATGIKLIIGNCKIETSATANGTYVNLGNGMVSNFSHVYETYTSQSGNGPDPIEGIAKESCVAEFTLIEYDASVLSAIQCGSITADTTTSSVQSTINAGGNSTLTPRAFKITNTRLVSGVTKQTVITVYYAMITTGLGIDFKTDNDSDPVATMPFTMMGENDTSRTAGSQLYKIVRDVV